MRPGPAENQRMKHSWPNKEEARHKISAKAYANMKAGFPRKKYYSGGVVTYKNIEDKVFTVNFRGLIFFIDAIVSFF